MQNPRLSRLRSALAGEPRRGLSLSLESRLRSLDTDLRLQQRHDSSASITRQHAQR